MNIPLPRKSIRYKYGLFLEQRVSLLIINPAFAFAKKLREKGPSDVCAYAYFNLKDTLSVIL